MIGPNDSASSDGSPSGLASGKGGEAALATGARVPDCMLLDVEGRELSLAQLYRQRPLVLVFYRGHWCPYCRRQLQRLQDFRSRLGEMGADVAAVAVDPPELARRLASELGLEFPLLSDVEGRAIDAFGVRNSLLGMRSGIPHPSVFIIDTDGVVKFREVRRNYKRRVSPGRLLRAIADALDSGQGGS